MASTLRQRKRTFEKTVESLDAFPKVPEPYVEQSSSHAVVNIVTWLLVMGLVWSEINYFNNPNVKLKFTPDYDYSTKLQINIDMTVATPCNCKETLLQGTTFS